MAHEGLLDHKQPDHAGVAMVALQQALKYLYPNEPGLVVDPLHMATLESKAGDRGVKSVVAGVENVDYFHGRLRATAVEGEGVQFVFDAGMRLPRGYQDPLVRRIKEVLFKGPGAIVRERKASRIESGK
jgi:hypothetical protein